MKVATEDSIDKLAWLLSARMGVIASLILATLTLIRQKIE